MNTRSAIRLFMSAAAIAIIANLWTTAAQEPALSERPALVVQTGHVGRMAAAAFSAEGRTIATGDHRGSIRIWDVESGRQLWTLPGHDTAIAALAFSPDGRWLASSSGFTGPFQVRIWDVAVGREKHRLEGHEDRVLNLAFSPDGSHLATAGEKVRIWSTDSGAQVSEIPVAENVYHQLTLAFSPDSKVIAVREPAQLRLLRIDRGDPPAPPISLSNSYGSTLVVFRRDGAQVATVDGQELKVWDTATRRQVSTTKLEFDTRILGFSQDGSEYAVRVDDRFEVWDAARGQRRRILADDVDGLSVLSPDWRRYTVQQSNQRTLALKEISSDRDPTILEARTPPAGAVAFSRSGDRLATKAGKRFWIWPLRTGEPQAFDGHDGEWIQIEIDTLAFMPDDRTFISADWTGRIVQWNLSSAKTENVVDVPTEASTRTHDVSADGRWLVSAEQGRIAVFELPAWQIRRTMEAEHRDIAISANGRFVASASFTSDPRNRRPPWIDLWDVQSGERRVLLGHDDWVTRVAFDAAGRWLASADLNGTIKLWDVMSGSVLKTLGPVMPEPVWSLAFSPDARLLAAGAPRNSIVLWDLRADRVVKQFDGHADAVGQVTFSPDGRFLASGSDGDTRVWDAESGTELVRLLVLEGSNDWLAAAPDGRFDGTPAARNKLVAWRVGSTVHPAERFSETFHTPGLLAGIFGGGRLAADQERQVGR